MNRVDKRRGPLINSHSISLGSSVTDLTLGGGMIRDNASLDMINKLGLPFLKSLTLDMACWALGSFHFTSTSHQQIFDDRMLIQAFGRGTCYCSKITFFLFNWQNNP